MSTAARHRDSSAEPVRILGRGIRAQRGVRLTIRALREAVGKTQVEVAVDASMDQSDVSRLEGRVDFEDCLVSTLRRYLGALGGRLELVASFGDKKIFLSGISADPPSEPNKERLKKSGRRRASRR